MKKLLLLLVAALALSACGGEESGSTDGEKNTTNFFDRYLNTLCDASLKCSSGLVNPANRLYCPRTILNSTVPFEGFYKGEPVIFKHKFEMLKNAEEAGSIFVDMNQAENCFSVVSQMEPCDPLDVQLLEIPECAEVFKGSKQMRQECSQDEECKNGWCNIKGYSCPGTCVEYKQPDQSCNSSTDKCVIGYECRSSGCSKSSTGSVNDPCVTNSDCTAFLFCYVKEGDSFGVCLKRKGEGMACTDENECAAGLSCTDNLCTRSRISDTAGSPCAESEDDEAVFECNRFSKLECASTGVCQEMPIDADLQCSKYCDADRGLYCDIPSHTCKWQKSLGTACDTNDQCISLYCAAASEGGKVCMEPQCLQTYYED